MIRCEDVLNQFLIILNLKATYESMKPGQLIMDHIKGATQLNVDIKVANKQLETQSLEAAVEEWIGPMAHNMRREIERRGGIKTSLELAIPQHKISMNAQHNGVSARIIATPFEAEFHEAFFDAPAIHNPPGIHFRIDLLFKS